MNVPGAENLSARLRNAGSLPPLPPAASPPPATPSDADSACVCVRERETERVCVCVCVKCEVILCVCVCTCVCAQTYMCVCTCTRVSVSVTSHVSVFFCPHCIRLHSEYAREREGARGKQCVKVCMCTCNAACIVCVHETLPVFTAHTHISRCSLATALARACQALHRHPQAPTCRSLCTQQLCSAFALSLVTEKARRTPDNMRVYVCMWSHMGVCVRAQVNNSTTSS